MQTGAAALARMRDPEAKVSAHYMVEEDGRVFALVPEDRRAWHAGVSEWGGETDVNSISVGIEIVNGGHDFGLPDYPAPQIEAVIALTRAVMARHGVPAHRVAGHSDVAPLRKIDPGEKFPWPRLAAAGCAIWPRPGPDAPQRAAKPGERSEKVRALQADLAAIGYGLAADHVYGAVTEAVIRAFQRRFRPARIDGVADPETAALIARVRALTPPS
ncbi:MAG: N-acetylmuramoyl-L-alanine amidase [Maricaulaceae bacterium]|nr:N-acetylmuramoyl-L-alanine amidase [Maricaulaceae bacterium]